MATKSKKKTTTTKKKSSKTKGGSSPKSAKAGSKKRSPVFVSELNRKVETKGEKKTEPKKDQGKAAYRFIAESYNDGTVKSLLNSLPERFMDLVSGLVSDSSTKSKKTSDLASMRRDWLKKRVLESKPLKAIRNRRKPK